MANAKSYQGAEPYQADDGPNGAAGNSAVQRSVITVGITAIAVLLLLLAWSAIDLLLLIFAGVLLAVFLRGLSDVVSTHTPLSAGWAMVVVVVALVAVIAVGGWLLAPLVANQVDQLSAEIPTAAGQLRQRVEHFRWGRRLLAQVPAPADLAPRTGNLVSRVTGVFSTALGALVNSVIVLFTGLYVAAEPGLYRSGLVHLVPVAKRKRAQEILSAVAYALRSWEVGTLISMTVVGVLTWLGLWLLGVPLALTLGLIAGLLEFIPNLGPILSGVPAVLLALVQGPTQALYVVLLYLAIQTFESYLLTPLVQKHAVSLPPALTISVLALGGILFGFLGLLLAVPLAAAAMVAVKMIYVEDILGDDSIAVKAEQHT